MAKCTGLELPKPDGDHSAILNSGKWEQAI